MRLDNLYLEQRSWPFAAWRKRYLDHPLVGVLARRLIWIFDRQAGIFHEDRLVSVDGTPLDQLKDETSVQLWHPIGASVEAVMAWRRHLEHHEISQPFKQAHREIYLLTDAERQTRTYSNRFASHILRQGQFHALCGVRGWRGSGQMMVDDSFPPAHKLISQAGLRAEFWTVGVGDEYDVDTNAVGTYLHVATDQVRFYPIETQLGAQVSFGALATTDSEPLPLDTIPPLVLSEIFRDVDLFVSVTSVGNDPNWADGGPDGAHQAYWHSYAFGDLSTTAQTRREVLERLLPRLKIASQATLQGRFLVVRGKLRTYKIHLGSANILMEPNDQYLRIIPGRSSSKAAQVVFLPFEGDRTLSLILSKAFLLAADDKIRDEVINQQIRRDPS